MPEEAIPQQSSSEATRRTCLFGGTFDPIHIAHLRIANEALKSFELKQVLFVPAANPPHKQNQPVTSYEDRFRMVEIACAPYPSFVASRLEAGQDKSYTLTTLQRVRTENPEVQLFFLIGADAFDEIMTWHEWEQVMQLTEFIVVSRPGRQYRIPPGARVHRLDNLELPVSSSTIRERLLAGENVPEVPAEVRDYIEQRHLYRGASKTTVSP